MHNRKLSLSTTLINDDVFSETMVGITLFVHREGQGWNIFRNNWMFWQKKGNTCEWKLFVICSLKHQLYTSIVPVYASSGDDANALSETNFEDA